MIWATFRLFPRHIELISKLNEQIWVDGDYLNMVYNFKVLWVGAYRDMGGLLE